MSFVSLYEEKEQFKQQANITAILAAASLEIKKSCACFSDWNWEQWTLYIFLGIFSLSAYSVGVFLLSLFLHKRKIKIGSYFGKVKKIMLSFLLDFVQKIIILIQKKSSSEE